MKKLPNFSQHGCYCEQKIAYNFLFTDAHINRLPLNAVLAHIDRNYIDLWLKKYDISAIKACIAANYDSYVKRPFIASSYGEIAKQLPLA